MIGFQQNNVTCMNYMVFIILLKILELFSIVDGK